MSDELLGDFGFDNSNWEEEAPAKQPEVKMDDWFQDEEVTSGLNVGLTAYEMKGKSVFHTLIGYLNTEYFDKFNVRENFPKCYELVKTGLVPEVEKVYVLDLDASYKKLSHLGYFGDLSKQLYKEKKIFRKTIKIPKRQVKYTNDVAREASKINIQNTKAKIENNITAVVKDNDPGVALNIDSMSSYDELLNNWFRIIYEDVLVKEEDKSLGTALKGIRQSYYNIRNGWWIETLRDKRDYDGWNFDTYKMEVKNYKYLKLEREGAHKAGKKPEDVLPYWIHWATKTEFELDLILNIDNDGTNYWAEVKNRFEGNVPIIQRMRCPYTPNKRRAIFEVLEKIAPYILGEVEKDGVMTKIEEEDLW